MKNFSILHLTGFSALGLLTACLAQHWFGEHDSYRRQASLDLDTWQQAPQDQQQNQVDTDKASVLRAEYQKQVTHQAQLRAERSRKEAAWKAFYTKPAQCEFPATDLLFAACTDDFIRAKRQFDQQYAEQTTLHPFQSSLASHDVVSDAQ